MQWNCRALVLIFEFVPLHAKAHIYFSTKRCFMLVVLVHFSTGLYADWMDKEIKKWISFVCFKFFILPLLLVMHLTLFQFLINL